MIENDFIPVVLSTISINIEEIITRLAKIIGEIAYKLS